MCIRDSSQHIGGIRINSDHSFVILPEGMPKPIFKDLKKAWVCGQKLQISRVSDQSKNAKDTDGAGKPSAPGRHDEKSISRSGSDDKNFGSRKHSDSKKPSKRNDRKDVNADTSKRKKNKDTKAGNLEPANDRKVRKDRQQSDTKKSRKKGRLALGEASKKSIKAKQVRDDSVAINKKRIRSIKSKREDGSVSEYIPATKSGKSAGKSEEKDKKTDAAEVKL